MKTLHWQKEGEDSNMGETHSLHIYNWAPSQVKTSYETMGAARMFKWSGSDSSTDPSMALTEGPSSPPALV